MVEKKTKDEKTQIVSFRKPFLIGLFIFSIVCVPILVMGTLILPLNDWLSLSEPLELSRWVLYGAITGLLLAFVLSILFARSISPEKRKE